MKEKLKWLPLLLIVGAVAAIGFCLLHYESEYLWKVQELNLFLDTPLFLKQQTVVSGWLLTWMGTWFTEFFYHPWQGVLMLCAWWVLLMLMAGRTFRVPLKWATVLLVPVAMLLLTDVDLGYWIYYLKLRGHFFAATIGATIAVGAVWLFRWLNEKCINEKCSSQNSAQHNFQSSFFNLQPSLFVLLSTILLYPLIGFYGLLATLLMAVITWRIQGLTLGRRIVTTVVALIAIGVVPLIYYRYVFCQTNMVNIYWTGLPLFLYDQETTEYYIPYYIIVAFFVVLAACYQHQRQGGVRRVWLWALCQVALLGGLGWATQHFWFRDFNFHKELRMQQCMEVADWQGVLREAAVQEDEPTRAIVMMRNLALFRLGRQGDEMYHYPAGAKASDTPLPIRMTQVVGRSIYYNYGQLNYCYRWCLEDGVEMGWRVEYLKYLTRCSLVNGEYRVARKYIDLLKHTRYHKAWAEAHERFLNNGEALRADKDFEPIFHMLPAGDKLASDNALVEYFLMHQFAHEDSDDPLYQEQTLLAALWTKDIQTFWPRFFHYAQLHPKEHMPVHYQEAAYLYGHLEHDVNISGMPFDEKVRKDYDEFMAMANRFHGMPEERLRTIMYPRFGKTFYFEYFLVRNQKLY
jgi:hypothetical protein